MNDNDLAKIITVVAIAAAMLVVGLMGYRAGSSVVTDTKDSRDHRAMELELADVKARLATLERIGVEIELKDNTSTWFVYNGRVQ